MNLWMHAFNLMTALIPLVTDLFQKMGSHQALLALSAIKYNMLMISSAKLDPYACSEEVQISEQALGAVKKKEPWDAHSPFL